MSSRASMFLRMAERVGISTAILVAFLLGGWEVLAWTANNVVLPVVNRHLAFIDFCEENNRRQTTAWEQLTGYSKEQTKLLQELVDSRKLTPPQEAR